MSEKKQAEVKQVEDVTRVSKHKGIETDLTFNSGLEIELGDPPVSHKCFFMKILSFGSQSHGYETRLLFPGEHESLNYGGMTRTREDMLKTHLKAANDYKTEYVLQKEI